MQDNQFLGLMHVAVSASVGVVAPDNIAIASRLSLSTVHLIQESKIAGSLIEKCMEK